MTGKHTDRHTPNVTIDMSSTVAVGPHRELIQTVKITNSELILKRK